jgi:hypothetical protein
MVDIAFLELKLINEYGGHRSDQKQRSFDAEGDTER